MKAKVAGTLLKRALPAILVGLWFQAPTVHAQILEGVVLEKGTGKPIEGARVQLLTGSVPTYNFGSPAQPDGETTTDALGSFSIATKPGRYRVVPVRDGLIFAHPTPPQFPREPGVWVELAEQQTIQGLKLEMQAESSISGRLLDSNGNVLPGPSASASLLVHRYDDYGERRLAGLPGIAYPGSAWSFVRADDRGEFRLYGLPSGDYYLNLGSGAVSVYVPGNTDEASAVPIHVEPGENLHLGTIMLPPPLPRNKVTLRFVRDGSPVVIPGVTVSILPVGTLYGTSGERAEMETTLPPGNYEVSVSSSFPVGDAYYGGARLAVGATDVVQEIEVRPSPRLKAKFSMDGLAMERPLACRMVGSDPFRLAGCSNTPVPPGHYIFGLQNLPSGAYVHSVTAGGRDVLAQGVEITGDTELDIQLGSHGAELQGTVTNANGETVMHAIAALVPDAPRRAAPILYKSGPADINGRFRLTGIAPGTYRLYAWPELPGAAYLNAEFMKDYENAGQAVRIETIESLTVDVIVSDTLAPAQQNIGK